MKLLRSKGMISKFSNFLGFCLYKMANERPTQEIAEGTSGSSAIKSKGKQKNGVNQIILETTFSGGNTFQLTPQYSLMIMAQVARISLINRVSDKTI